MTVHRYLSFRRCRPSLNRDLREEWVLSQPSGNAEDELGDSAVRNRGFYPGGGGDPDAGAEAGDPCGPGASR